MSLQLVSACAVDAEPAEAPSMLAATTQDLRNGTVTSTGYLEAVGSMNGVCTATLVDHQVVLTAAHCVCPNDTNAQGCATRAAIGLRDVRPVDDPSTQTDESATRTKVIIHGDVTVHPDYAKAGWLRKDYAVIVLDEPAYKHALDVVPIPIAQPTQKPTTNDTLMLVGYGTAGADCSQPFGTKRTTKVKPSEVVTEAIRFSPDAACPGDSGGPALDKTFSYVVGTASWGDGATGTYRPVYEVAPWIQSFIDDAREAAGADTFRVAKGNSANLDAHESYGYWPEVGIVAVDIASDDAVYTWYNNGTVTMGLSWALDSSTRGTYPFKLPAGKKVSDIVEIAIAPDDVVYTWYRDGTLSKGSTSDLGSISASTSYTVPAGKTPSDIVGIAIAKSTSHVYAWYKDGTASSGRSTDLDAIRSPYAYSPLANKTPTDIVGVGIASDDKVFSWYRYAGEVFPVTE